MSEFNHLGIICKPDETRVSEIVSILLPILKEKGLEYSLDDSVKSAGYLDAKTISRSDLVETADLFIVIGGDGTFLGAARSLINSEKPLLGVNAGRLGFLADIAPEKLQHELDEILSGEYILEDRILLDGEITGNTDRPIKDIALNDISIHMRNTIRMIEFETKVDNQALHTLRADGLIVSTPTGSTAYSLSAGGPVIHPGLNVLSLAPICPHTLSSRPIVVNGNSEIEINLLSDCDVPAVVAFDGQNTHDIEPGDTLKIKTMSKTLKVMHPKSYDYYHVLRNKLHWSEQP